MENSLTHKEAALAGRAEVAVVTGAAGGLGSAFAREIAARGYRLLLTDRDGAGLAALSASLPGSRTVVADLSRPDDQERLASELADVDLLVNNAGFGTYAMFHEADLETQLAMVEVHVNAAMRLTRAALPGMVARGHGSVINVASAGAFMRFPRDATYIGTKAFLVAFTECLAIELVGTGVTVQALCPAWVRTGFASRGDYSAVGYETPIPDWFFSDPERVVASSLNALGHGSTRHIPTLRGRLAVAAIGSRPGQALLAAARRRRDAAPT